MRSKYHVFSVGQLLLHRYRHMALLFLDTAVQCGAIRTILRPLHFREVLVTKAVYMYT